jgi:hypothetical protein
MANENKLKQAFKRAKRYLAPPAAEELRPVHLAAAREAIARAADLIDAAEAEAEAIKAGDHALAMALGDQHHALDRLR